MSRVGVVIPCYNHGVYLREALESVIWQTEEVSWTVVVDDASETPVLEAVPGIRLIGNIGCIRNDLNLGPSISRNTGVQFLIDRGCDTILPLDADDQLEPGMIEFGLKTLDIGVDMAYPSVEYFGQKRGKFKCPIRPPDEVAKKIMSTNEMVVSTLYKAEIWQAVKERNGTGYDPELHKPEHYGWEDWLFWIEAHLLGFRARAIGGSLLRVRISPDSGVWKANKNADNVWAYFRKKIKRLYNVQLPNRAM